MKRSYVRPILGGWRTLAVLLYLKLKHNAQGWKYFFGSVFSFNVNSGSIDLSPGLWIEELSKIIVETGSLKIGSRTFINRCVTLVVRDRIEIGNDVLIGNNVSIYDHDHIVIDRRQPYGQQGYNTAPIIIGNNVWIGCNSTILKGVTVGNGAVVAAGSVVVRSIPDNELWAGVPARRVRKLH